MKITEDQIAEIADYLDSGLICFFHSPTSTIEYYPDPDNPYFEAEMWQEVIDKIENDQENYDRFTPMSSRDSYRVREKFAHSLTDIRFGGRLLDALAKRKPFRNFGYLIDDSHYRQDWFDFKKEACIAAVRDQMDTYEEE